MGINGGLTARYISEKYFSMICGAQVELNFPNMAGVNSMKITPNWNIYAR